MPTLQQLNQQYSGGGNQSNLQTQPQGQSIFPSGANPMNIQQQFQPQTPPPVQSTNASADKGRGIIGNILPVGGSIALPALADFFTDGFATPVDMALSGIGAGIGETIQQGIENLTGSRKGINLPQVANTTEWSALAEGVGQAIAPIAKTAVKAVALFSNTPSDLLFDAIKNPQDYSAGYKGGKDFLTGVVKTAGDKLGQMSDALSTNLKELIKPIADNTIQGGKEAIGGLMDRVNGFLKDWNVTAGQQGLSKFGPIKGVSGIPTDLSFDDPKLPSSIVNPSERKAVQNVYNMISNLSEKTTNEELNAVKTTINKTWSDMSDGSGKGLVGKMQHAVQDFIMGDPKKGLISYAPDLAKVRAEIKPAEQLIENVKSIIPNKAGGDMTDEELDGAIKKLSGLAYQTGKDVSNVAKGVGKFSEQTGQNILKDVAGAKIGGAQLEGLAKVPPGNITQAMSKAVRPIWAKIAALPLKSPELTGLISQLIDKGIPQDVIRTTLQSLNIGKKQGQ